VTVQFIHGRQATLKIFRTIEEEVERIAVVAQPAEEGGVPIVAEVAAHETASSIQTTRTRESFAENIRLSDLKTTKEMHDLMVAKGFVRKSKEEINQLKLQKREEDRLYLEGVKERHAKKKERQAQQQAKREQNRRTEEIRQEGEKQQQLQQEQQQQSMEERIEETNNHENQTDDTCSDETTEHPFDQASCEL